MMFRRIFAVCAAFTFIACSSEKSDFGAEPPGQEREVELPPAQRSEKLPNDLFLAVWNQNEAEVESLSKARPALLESRNAEGDTPLGMALKQGYRKVTSALLKQTPVAKLFELNAGGESYVVLASRSGFHEAVTWMAELYASSVPVGLPANFQDLDRKTGDGRRALFFASDRRVAQALETQYHRDLYGVVHVPVVGSVRHYFWDFVLERDVNEKNFLHAAAESGRPDLILWANERLCVPGEWERSDQGWKWVLGNLGTYGWGAVEAYLPEEWILNSPSSQLFNRQDKLLQTPLHLALASRQWDSAVALLSCRWINVDLTDAAGDLPLHAFLKALNPQVLRSDEKTRSTFVYLLNQTTMMYAIWKSIPGRVNTVNADGNSAMHLAARLADPFFFETLSAYGDRNMPDREGVTAIDRFESRQRQVSTHGQ